MKVGAAHWKLLIFFNTPILINLLTSFLELVCEHFEWEKVQHNKALYLPLAL